MPGGPSRSPTNLDLEVRIHLPLGFQVAFDSFHGDMDVVRCAAGPTHYELTFPSRASLLALRPSVQRG